MLTLMLGCWSMMSASAAGQVTEQDKFELWNESGPVSLDIVLQSNNNSFAGLEDKIRIAAESRLRVAQNS